MIGPVNEMALQPASVISARIKTVLDNKFLVQDSSGAIYKATRAPSCLLCPEAGDHVLVASVTIGKNYIWAILERDGDSHAEISMEGDSSIKVRGGKLEISADSGIDIGCPIELNLLSKKINLTSEQTQMLLGKLTVLGTVAKTHFDKIKVKTNGLESVVGRAIQHFKSRFTNISSIDRIKSKVTHQEAKEVLAIRSKFTVLTAKNDVKIDGKQILMG